MDSGETIKDAGLKVTPQRKAVFEAMTQLCHATADDVVTMLHRNGNDMTVSTVYRVLDSFCKTGILSQVSHPETGRCYYDINAREHSHLFSGKQIIDYDDEELTEMVRKYLKGKEDIPGKINRVQIQIILNEV